MDTDITAYMYIAGPTILEEIYYIFCVFYYFIIGGNLCFIYYLPSAVLSSSINEVGGAIAAPEPKT